MAREIETRRFRSDLGSMWAWRFKGEARWSGTRSTTEADARECAAAAEGAAEIKRAKATATAHHAGITDRSGKPYIGHPARVAAAIEAAGGSPAAIAAAWGHDILEDAAADGTMLTAAHLRSAGFSPEAIEAIEAVTKLPTETYFEFIARAAAHETGRAIKAADLADNMLPERGGFPGHASLMKRYEKALAILRG